MRLIFKISILLPLLLMNVSCSANDKLSFNSDKFTFDTYFNDSYFLLDNREVHEEIALASHAMALATFNKNEDYSLRGEYLRDLWSKEGFEKIYLCDSFYKKPEMDSIGYGIASKYINIDNSDFTLLAIAVRGGNYEAEWASNVKLGLEGNAHGFDEASDTVVQGIKDYISSNNIKGHIKVWISGYSRAAITSNMTAGKLLNSMTGNKYEDSMVNFTSDDIYAYCFEPPMGVQISLEEARGDLYHGIHNFLNYNDFVPLVAPIEWGFVRYGNDHYYPDRLNDIYFDETEREKIISLYHFTYGAQNFHEYSVDKWKFFDVGENKALENNLPRETINPSQGRFSHTLIHELAVRGFQDRELFSLTMEDGLRNIFATVFGLNENIDKINTSNILDIIFEYDFVKSLLIEIEEGKSADFAFDMQMLFLQIFGANENNFQYVQDLYQENFSLFYFLPLAFSVRKDIAAQLLYRDNALGIAIGHMPELSYSFLSACDSRFLGEKKCKFNDGSYSVLHIANPTSFAIYEKNLQKDIFKYIDGVMTSSHVCAEKLADGSLNVYLPNNGEYQYKGVCDSIRLGKIDPLLGEATLLNEMPNTGEF